MGEVQDTQYGIIVDATGKMMMWVVVKNMEPYGTLNAEKAFTMKDAVFALQIVLMA